MKNITQQEIVEIFSTNLPALRRKLGLTQQKLADKLGLQRCRIGAWEEGRALPPIELLITLSSLFEVDTLEMLTNEHIAASPLTHTDKQSATISKSLAMFNALEALDRSLRKDFDNGFLHNTKVGALNAAIELGRIDLATEMQSDLNEIMSQGREVA